MSTTTKLVIPVRTPMLASLCEMFKAAGLCMTLEAYAADLLETVIADYRSRALPAEVRAVAGFHRAGKVGRVDGIGDFRTVLSPEDRKRIISLYKSDGISPTNLAERFHCSAKTVRSVLYAAGIRTHEKDEDL